MIEPTDIIPTLLNICPGFKPRWEEHLRYWHRGDNGIFNDTAEFVHYLVDCYENGDRAAMPLVFETIERFIVDGTEETRGITIVGILETLQTVASNRPFGEDVFVEYLGPKSREAWIELVGIWEGKSSLADVIRAERKGKGAVNIPEEYRWTEADQAKYGTPATIESKWEPPADGEAGDPVLHSFINGIEADADTDFRATVEMARLRNPRKAPGDGPDSVL
jgi:hypothetical protein